MFPNFTKSIFKLVFFYYENIINDCKNIIFLYHFNENFIDKEWNLIITKRIFRNVYNSYFKFANDFLLFATEKIEICTQNIFPISIK